MPEMTVAPAMPVVPAAAAAKGAGGQAEGFDPAAAAPAGADFAAVLKDQIARPARGPADAQAVAALTADASESQDSDDGTAPEAAAVTAPDLAALLPGLAILAQPAVSAEGKTTDAPAALAAPAAAASRVGMPTLRPAGIDPGTEAGDPPRLTMARQPAVIAVAERAAAETAAAARSTAEPALPEQASPIAEAAPVAAQHASRLEPSAVVARAAQAAAHVDTPVGARGWDGEVGQKLVWMVGREESRAELTLTPPHMGKVEVTLSVSGDQTNALFVSANPAARDALEQALPRLRELLADAGISLGQASVNAESPQRDREDGGRNAPGRGRGDAAAGAARGATASAPWIRQGSGLVDTFA